MHYYKRHLGDYAKDTRHLTMLQHGAFTLLLDWYYSSERPLPLDRCDRIANAGTPAERDAVQFVLRDFFVETPEGWISRRADKEIAAMQEKSGKAANSAKARWDNNQGMRTHSERIANAVPTQCEGNASHKPLSTIQEPEEQKQQLARTSSTPAVVSPTIMGLTLNDGTEYPVTEKQAQDFGALYPAVDVVQALRSMQGWCISNPKQRKTKSGIMKFINSWLAREQNNSRKEPSHANSTPSRKLSLADQAAQLMLERRQKRAAEAEAAIVGHGPGRALAHDA
jgi:uncharacterized protein YdaU (DUF1376 family)